MGWGDTSQPLPSQALCHLPTAPHSKPAPNSSCARHRDASGHLQPCGCCCLHWSHPFPTMSPCNCPRFTPTHCPQHFPAQGLKPAAAGKSKEWVWGRKGNNLPPAQWAGLSELLRPQFILEHTLELLFWEMSQDAARGICKPASCAREQEWEQIKVPAGLLSLLLGSLRPFNHPTSSHHP